MLIIALALLAQAFAPTGHLAADDLPEVVLDELGMPPRPTLECGGRDAVRRWERERFLRRTERAREQLSPFVHYIGDRLSAGFHGTVGALHVARLEAFEACLDEEPARALTCVAAVKRRPAICAHRGGAFARACSVAAVALAGVLDGDHLRCAELTEPPLRRLCERAVMGRPERSVGCPKDDRFCHVLTVLNADVCRAGWRIIQTIQPSREICSWVMLVELLREDPMRSCDTMPAPLRDLCRGVLSGDPDTCPEQAPHNGAAVMARRCRNARVLVSELPLDQTEYSNGVIFSVPLMNSFSVAAACRLTARLSEGDRVRFEAVSEPFTLAGQDAVGDTELLVSKRFRMAPAKGGLELSVAVDCAWGPLDTAVFRSDSVFVVD